jgi:hypothetical protein
MSRHYTITISDGGNKISRKLKVVPSNLSYVDGEELLNSCIKDMIFEKW